MQIPDKLARRSVLAAIAGAGGASEALGPSTSEPADACGRARRTRWVPFVCSLKIDIG